MLRIAVQPGIRNVRACVRQIDPSLNNRAHASSFNKSSLNIYYPAGMCALLLSYVHCTQSIVFQCKNR
jgi:hypothetical protein